MAPPKIPPTSSLNSEYEHAQSISEARQFEAEKAAGATRMSQVERDGFWEKVKGEDEEEDEIDNEDTQPTPSPPAQDLDLDLPGTGPAVNNDKQEAEAEGPLSSSQTSFDEKSLQHRSEDVEMMHDEDASERFGTAPMHPHREPEPEASHNNPSPNSNMDTNTTNNNTNIPKGGNPPQTPKNLTSGHNKQITEPEQPHAASVYRALLPTNMTCTLAPKLDQKGIEAENIKTTKEIDARLIALREEWNDLSEKFENWADRGFEAQERRIRCQLRANLMQCAEKEQETHAEQEKLIQFNDSLRQVYAAYLGAGRKQMA